MWAINLDYCNRGGKIRDSYVHLIAWFEKERPLHIKFLLFDNQ